MCMDRKIFHGIPKYSNFEKIFCEKRNDSSAPGIEPRTCNQSCKKLDNVY